MNKTSGYVSLGLGIFALIAITAFATVYASQTGHAVLLYIAIAVNLILSLFLLIFLMQSNKESREAFREIDRLKQREEVRLQKEQHSTAQAGNDTEEIKADEVLAKIIPAEGTSFAGTENYTETILQNAAKELDIVQGLVFVLNDDDHLFHVSGEYAYFSEKPPRSFPIGETLSGQVAKNRKLLNVKEMPEGYITILSGLGRSDPRHLVIAPIISGGESIGVIELASFKPFSSKEEQVIEKIAGSMANQLNELRK